MSFKTARAGAGSSEVPGGAPRQGVAQEGSAQLEVAVPEQPAVGSRLRTLPAIEVDVATACLPSRRVLRRRLAMSWTHVGGQGPKFVQCSLGRSGPAWSPVEGSGRVEGMSDDKQIFASGFSRRSFLKVVGGAPGAVAIPLQGATEATARPAEHPSGERTAPAVRGRCIQRGRRVVAHLAAGAAPPGSARRTGWTLPP